MFKCAQEVGKIKLLLLFADSYIVGQLEIKVKVDVEIKITLRPYALVM